MCFPSVWYAEQHKYYQSKSSIIFEWLNRALVLRVMLFRWQAIEIAILLGVWVELIAAFVQKHTVYNWRFKNDAVLFPVLTRGHRIRPLHSFGDPDLSPKYEMYRKFQEFARRYDRSIFHDRDCPGLTYLSPIEWAPWMETIWFGNYYDYRSAYFHDVMYTNVAPGREGALFHRDFEMSQQLALLYQRYKRFDAESYSLSNGTFFNLFAAESMRLGRYKLPQSDDALLCITDPLTYSDLRRYFNSFNALKWFKDKFMQQKRKHQYVLQLGKSTDWFAQVVDLLEKETIRDYLQAYGGSTPFLSLPVPSIDLSNIVHLRSLYYLPKVPARDGSNGTFRPESTEENLMSLTMPVATANSQFIIESLYTAILTFARQRLGGKAIRRVLVGGNGHVFNAFAVETFLSVLTATLADKERQDLGPMEVDVASQGLLTPRLAEELMVSGEYDLCLLFAAGSHHLSYTHELLDLVPKETNASVNSTLFNIEEGTQEDIDDMEDDMTPESSRDDEQMSLPSTQKTDVTEPVDGMEPEDNIIETTGGLQGQWGLSVLLGKDIRYTEEDWRTVMRAIREQEKECNHVSVCSIRALQHLRSQRNGNANSAEDIKAVVKALYGTKSKLFDEVTSNSRSFSLKSAISNQASSSVKLSVRRQLKKRYLSILQRHLENLEASVSTSTPAGLSQSDAIVTLAQQLSLSLPRCLGVKHVLISDLTGIVDVSSTASDEDSQKSETVADDNDNREKKIRKGKPSVSKHFLDALIDRMQSLSSSADAVLLTWTSQSGSAHRNDVGTITKSLLTTYGEDGGREVIRSRLLVPKANNDELLPTSLNISAPLQLSMANNNESWATVLSEVVPRTVADLELQDVDTDVQPPGESLTFVLASDNSFSQVNSRLHRFDRFLVYFDFDCSGGICRQSLWSHSSHPAFCSNLL